MFSLFKGFFQSVTANEEIRILLVGCENSGKSVCSPHQQTWVNQLKSQFHKHFAKREKIKPTMGLNGRLLF
jgi:hypothetical protein